MTPIIIATLEVLACIGLGASFLRFTTLVDKLDNFDRWMWSFALGFGFLGWFLFFVGIFGFFSKSLLLCFLIVSSTGIVFLFANNIKLDKGIEAAVKLNKVDACLLFATLCVLGFDLVEGLSPPADADSVAYHFLIPKEFFIDGEIRFIPRAMDGAIPLLVQLTYLPAYGLGGEKAMTLWTMVSGWGAGGLIVSVARKWVGTRWAIAITLVYLTTPAVVYGGGSGHVEVRLILFILLAAISIVNAISFQEWRFSIIAGIALGFLVTSKYTGLVFGAGIFLTFLVFLYFRRGRAWIILVLIFGACVGVTGSQWYVWNWWHTGDPVFPILFEALGLFEAGTWDANHHRLLKSYLVSDEQAVERSLLWFIGYPFVATFNGPRVFEAGRTGFGPYLVLVFPIFVLGLWHLKHRILSSRLAPIIVICAVSYALWFFVGSSQRVRHLLPLYPLALIGISVVVVRWCEIYNKNTIFSLFLCGTLAVQMFGHMVFTINYARFVFTNENRHSFLARNQSDYDSVFWINNNLNQSHKLYNTFRHLNYYFNIPIYYAHWVQEALVDIRPTARNPKKYFSQLLDQKVTHILVTDPPEGNMSGPNQWHPLVAQNCLKLLATHQKKSIGSRALQTISPGATKNHIFKLTPDKCILGNY